MQRTRIQRGGVNLDISASGKTIWVFQVARHAARWTTSNAEARDWHVGEIPHEDCCRERGKGVPHELDRPGNDRADNHHDARPRGEHELLDRGEEGKAYSTRDRCESVLNTWVLPRWQRTSINEIRTVAVEQWLRSIARARGTKAKIRNTMSGLFNHAIRWGFARNNPITGPVRGSGVRQSAKRERAPVVLDVAEFQRLLAELKLRERVLVWVSMTTGLRRGELAALNGAM